MSLAKGDIAIGGPDGHRWTAKVLSLGKNISVLWLSGPLKNREGRVPKEHLKLGSKKR